MEWLDGYIERIRPGLDESSVVGLTNSIGSFVATLAQLIQVVSRNKELLASLGFNSRSEFEKTTTHIPETRNWVMHPVRPLIFDTADVATLRETVASV